MAKALAWADLEFESLLGEGQSGTVFRAHLRRTVANIPEGTVVAVKRYKHWVLEERGQIERIFKEVSIGREIDHPNLLKVYSAVLDSDGRPAIVMRLLDGPTLEQRLGAARETDGLVAFSFAFRVLRGLASGLQALHERGLIHRDVKPANVIVTDDAVVLADFGVIKSHAFPEQTTTGAFLGTIRYAAPEYVFGLSYDERIDVYSLGAIAYELLIGKQQHHAEQHWARLVIAKRRTPSLSIDEVRSVAARSNYNMARFVRALVNRSRAVLGGRTLDLSSVVAAIDAEAWTKTFDLFKGKFIVGAGDADPLFQAAQEAANTIWDVLLSAEIERIRRMLRARFMSSPSVWSSDDRKFLRRLEPYGLATLRTKNGQSLGFTFTKSVVEAFALDMF